MAMRQQVFIWAALALMLANQALAQGAPGPRGPTEVGVMAVAQEDVPYTVTLPGRATAYQQTSIRPQVGGEGLEIT